MSEQTQAPELRWYVHPGTREIVSALMAPRTDAVGGWEEDKGFVRGMGHVVDIHLFTWPTKADAIRSEMDKIEKLLAPMLARQARLASDLAQITR